MQCDTCGMLIKKIHDAVGKHINNSLRENDLTHTQVRVLMELGDDRADAMSMKELERRFNVAQSTIVGVVRRLEAKKLVRGFTAPGDNRVKLVSLTPEGEDFRKKNMREIEEMEERLLSRLTEEDKQAFLRMLLTVYNNVK